MLSLLRKFMSPRRPDTELPVECVFTLDREKRRDLIAHLRAILELPGAALSYPNIGLLHSTVARNRDRIRVPQKAMLVLVRELIAARHRIPDGSPLYEIIRAIPGLARDLELPTGLPDAFARRQADLRAAAFSPQEQDVEIARIHNLLSRRARANTAANAAAPAAPRAGSSQSRVKHGAAAAGPRIPDLATLAGSTQELSDEDLSAYIDLCILNGEQARVIDILATRIAERPAAWSWARLLELADTERDTRLVEFRESFLAWAREHHPHLLPDMLGEPEPRLFFGLRNDPLRELERRELGIAA